MASRSRDYMAMPWQSGQLPWLVRQALLVPEGLLLLVLLVLHALIGGSLLLALAGVALVVVFLLRSGLLLAARRALRNSSYKHAERLLTLALRLHPWSADALALRGLLHLSLGRPEQAEADLRRALALFPGRAALHDALGSALLDQGRFVEARWECIHALKLGPASAHGYLHLAQAEQRLGAPATDVERHLRDGLGVCDHPADEGSLRCALALLLIEQGRDAEARLAVAGVEALAARCTPIARAALLFHLAEVERSGGDLEAARSHFRTSEELDPHGRNAAAAWRAARS